MWQTHTQWEWFPPGTRVVGEVHCELMIRCEYQIIKNDYIIIILNEDNNIFISKIINNMIIFTFS